MKLMSAVYSNQPRTADEILSESEAFFTLELPLELSEGLDESVRTEYKRLWETVQQARE